MFTGIIEQIGELVAIQQEQENKHFTLKAAFTHELKIDQSVAHDGCCLTVVAIEGDCFTVTAIQETLQKTTLNFWKIGKKINLERCMQLGARLDGHIVQGHVDKTAECIEVIDENGSTQFTFRYEGDEVTVEKGSITLNGVSLTVVHSQKNTFSVCVIPYTLEHTNLGQLKKGDTVNVEFDVIGKYVARLLENRS